MQPHESALRQMRIICGVFSATVLAYAVIAEQQAHAGGEISAVFVVAIAIVAVIDLLIAVYFRQSKIPTAIEILRRNPNDNEALKKWRFPVILSLVLAESIALYGLVLRVMGASRRISWPFYIVALALMVLWWPRLDLPVTSTAPRAT